MPVKIAPLTPNPKTRIAWQLETGDRIQFQGQPCEVVSTSPHLAETMMPLTLRRLADGETITGTLYRRAIVKLIKEKE